MNIYAAYGSSKDINVYQSAGIPLSKMYIVKPKNPKRKHQVGLVVFRKTLLVFKFTTLFVVCFNVSRFKHKCADNYCRGSLLMIGCLSTDDFVEKRSEYNIQRLTVLHNVQLCNCTFVHYTFVHYTFVHFTPCLHFVHPRVIA